MRPKPTLGYPSRTAAVQALRRQNVDTAGIARRIGIHPKAVVALEASARRTRAIVAEGNRTVLFPKDTLDRLAFAAADRAISANELARRIVETVIDDGLIDAVLDDGLSRRGPNRNSVAKTASDSTLAVSDSTPIGARS